MNYWMNMTFARDLMYKVRPHKLHAEKLLIIDTLSFMHPPKVLKMIPNDNVSILETCIRKLVS